MLFKKKKLTLREIHQLYLLLKPCLPEKEEEYLIDEIIHLVEKMPEGMFLKSIEIMNGKVEGRNILELLTVFVDGLQNNGFFEYAKFVKGINGKT